MAFLVPSSSQWANIETGLSLPKIKVIKAIWAS